MAARLNAVDIQRYSSRVLSKGDRGGWSERYTGREGVKEVKEEMRGIIDV